MDFRGLCVRWAIKGNTLSGNYWTDRKTTGCFELIKE